MFLGSMNNTNLLAYCYAFIRNERQLCMYFSGNTERKHEKELIVNESHETTGYYFWTANKPQLAVTILENK